LVGRLKMTIQNMALVNPNGQVVSKIVIDTNIHYMPPEGWSVHIWTEPLDDEAYNAYLQKLGVNKWIIKKSSF